MVAEDVQRMACNAACRNVEYARQQLARDFVHVRDHQKKTLRSGKGGGQRTGCKAAVNCACGTGLRLHLHNIYLGAEDIFGTKGTPLVNTVSHRAGERSGKWRQLL